MNDVKPGFTTTEFWITLGTKLFAIGTVTGLVRGIDEAEASAVITRVVGAVAVLIFYGGLALHYIHGRVQQKREAGGPPIGLAMLLVLCLAGPAMATPLPAATMTLYGYARGPARSHTWAVFTRGTETVTISWFPVSSVPGPGRNLSDTETRRVAAAVRARVVVYGPYRIHGSLYQAAAKRAQVLESGAIGYSFLDRHSRPYSVNCIHAVSDLGGHVHTGTAYGPAASERVLGHLGRWIVP